MSAERKMYLRLLFASVLINIVYTYDDQLHNVEDSSKSVGGSETKNNQGITSKQGTTAQSWQQHFWKPSHHRGNQTYVDKTENIIRLPEIAKNNADKKKVKKNKKHPRKTIQKIIKKKGTKSKRVGFTYKPTSHPTIAPKENYDNYYAREEMPQWKKDATTFRPKEKKKSRRWNQKTVRNPAPFQNLHKNKRDKRNARNDLYVFKDLDEMKFIKNDHWNDKDYSVVNAHVKKYW